MFDKDANNAPGPPKDARNLSVAELLSAIHSKFSANFDAAKPNLALAAEVERKARILTVISRELEKLAGDSKHQKSLARCLDEVFADSVCAFYLGSCGMHVPARMLLRRSLELGLVVTAYWDSPVNFWSWREHDVDISFSAICDYLQSNGFSSLIAHQSSQRTVDITGTLKVAASLYRELSNVVHPKSYNFSTTGLNTFGFAIEDFGKTVKYAGAVHSVIANILAARFGDVGK